MADREVGASWFLIPPVKAAALRGFLFLDAFVLLSNLFSSSTYHTIARGNCMSFGKVLRLGLILVVSSRVRPRCKEADRTSAVFACRIAVLGDKTELESYSRFGIAVPRSYQTPRMVAALRGFAFVAARSLPPFDSFACTTGILFLVACRKRSFVQSAAHHI